MPGIPRLSLVEGAFEELAQELATYLDALKGDGSTIASEVTPLLADADSADKQTDKDEVLKKLVTASSILNNAPEREVQAAYNLLIHLISHSDDPDRFLPPVCNFLTKPITSSPQNGTGIALGVLATIFNTLQPDDETRYHVLLAIVSLIRNSGNFDTLQPQLAHLDEWVQSWEMEPEQARQLYLAISDAATAAHESQQAYTYLLRALRTLQQSSDASSDETRSLSIRALKAALNDPSHFDFQDLTALDSIQALRKSSSDDTQPWADLLELFSAETFDDLQEFVEASPDFLSSNNLSEEVLTRKMRLLTLASLAAHESQTRTLSYSRIASALAIPSEDVEMWVIDCIRSGLVEGKLSQQRQEFLIHRSTYRVFGENQWREVASRLETWRASLVGVLAIVRQQKEEFIREKEAELAGQQQMESRQSGGGGAWGRPRPQRNAVEVE